MFTLPRMISGAILAVMTLHCAANAMAQQNEEEQTPPPKFRVEQNESAGAPLIRARFWLIGADGDMKAGNGGASTGTIDWDDAGSDRGWGFTLFLGAPRVSEDVLISGDDQDDPIILGASAVLNSMKWDHVELDGDGTADAAGTFNGLAFATGARLDTHVTVDRISSDVSSRKRLFPGLWAGGTLRTGWTHWEIEFDAPGGSTTESEDDIYLGIQIDLSYELIEEEASVYLSTSYDAGLDGLLGDLDDTDRYDAYEIDAGVAWDFERHVGLKLGYRAWDVRTNYRDNGERNKFSASLQGFFIEARIRF